MEEEGCPSPLPSAGTEEPSHEKMPLSYVEMEEDAHPSVSRQLSTGECSPGPEHGPEFGTVLSPPIPLQAVRGSAPAPPARTAHGWRTAAQPTPGPSAAEPACTPTSHPAPTTRTR